MESDQSYWTDTELRLELLKGLEATPLSFRQRLLQILLDMRLHHESTESILRMVARLVDKADEKSYQLFLENTQRVAFDTRLAPHHSDAFIHFLRRIQQLKQTEGK